MENIDELLSMINIVADLEDFKGEKIKKLLDLSSKQISIKNEELKQL